MRFERVQRLVVRLLAWCVFSMSILVFALSLASAIFPFSGGAGWMHLGPENTFAFGVVVWNRSIYLDWDTFTHDAYYEVPQSEERWVYEYSFSRGPFVNRPEILAPPEMEPQWFYGSRLWGYSIDGPMIDRSLQDRVIEVYLNGWVAALIFAVAPLIGIYRFIRKRRVNRARARLCLQCGYDLRATPTRCPECGTRTAAIGSIAAARDGA